MPGDELLKTGPRNRVDNGQKERPLCDFSQDHSAGKAAAGMLPEPMKSAVLNTSLSTARQWEIGDKRPSRPPLKPRS